MNAENRRIAIRRYRQHRQRLSHHRARNRALIHSRRRDDVQLRIAAKLRRDPLQPILQLRKKDLQDLVVQYGMGFVGGAIRDALGPDYEVIRQSRRNGDEFDGWMILQPYRPAA